MNPKLASLLLDLEGLTDEEAEEKTYQEYINLYTDTDTAKGRRGELEIHDKEKVVFFEDRFEHAFFTSAYKTSRQYNKDKFVRQRATRLFWIRAILQGQIDKAEGWRMPSERFDSSGRPILKRLYVLWDENYLIWLEYLTKEKKWKFSSAYVESGGKRRIREITRMGVCFWRKKISRD